ncbi:MAG TPA: hypothetical protein ENI55_04715 [Alphaproteobacteria bacterium]|nr:hypothetical protein [Alphaproteobacteria bacterium]
MPESAAGTVGEITTAARTGAGNNGADNGAKHPARLKIATGAGDYPSARFINGEFRAQTFSDEALLYALAE